MDDSTNFQRNFSTGEAEVEGSTIYHKTEYRERRDHYALYTVNAPVDGFDTSRDAFLGAWRSNANPEVVEKGACTNSVAHGWAPVGVHQINVTLNPGESRSLIYMLGYIENPQEEKWAAPGVINKTRAHELMARYATDAQVDEALAKLHTHWNNLLSTYAVRSSDEKLDRMVNIWNQYQCMVTFNMSRSASYYESGTGRGMGFRDSCQDLLGFVHLIPARARERILDIAATQFPDGSAYHQYQPLTKKGNMDVGSGFNDDPLWLIAAVYAYLGETGDMSILDEQVDFDNDHTLAQPLLEHLRRSFGYLTTHKGPHGLPLIGRADWNDCLNLNCFSDTPGESFQTTGPSEGPVAESVFIAGMYVKYGNEFAEILDATNHADEAAAVRDEVAKMEHAALTAGWDGKWFRRLRCLRPCGRRAGVRGRPDLHRAPRHVCHGGHRRGHRRGRDRAAERTDPAGHQVRYCFAAACLYQISSGAGRNFQLPPGLQGERRHLLPQQPLGQLCRDRRRPRRPGV